MVGSSEKNIKTWPNHSHDHWELIYNVQGNGIISFEGGEEYTFKPYDIFLIPPGVSHYKFSDIYYQDIFIRIDDSRLKEKRITVFCDTDKTVLKLLKIANRSYHKNEFLVLESLWDVIYNIIFTCNKPKERSREVEQLINILIDNMSNPNFKIGDMTDTTHYCTDHIRRIFKAQTGYTPIDFLNNLRIKQACAFLKNNDNSHYTIADIALMCGFYDSAYFSRFFKKNMGVSPLEYRNKK